MKVQTSVDTLRAKAGTTTSRRRSAPIASVLLIGLAYTALLAFDSTAGKVYAQTDGQSATGTNFVAKIRDSQRATQRIQLAKDRSVIIETSIPFVRVEAVGQGIVRVDPVSPTQLLVTGEDFGATQVMVWSDSGDRHIFEVVVELDLALLNSAIKQIDPQADARAVSMMGNVLIVGTVAGVHQAERIAEIAELYLSRIAVDSVVRNHLMIAAEQQVLLKCVVAEVSRSATRELGVNGFLAGENFRDGFAVSQIAGGNPINIGPAAGFNVRQNIPFITGDIAISPSTSFSIGFPRGQLQLFINAMSDNALVRILAEPTLVAISGESASFLAGGEFPVPIPQSGQAAGAITIKYKEFGVELSFTPLVLTHQRIRLTVRPGVSSRDETGGLLTPSGFVPALITRRVETTVVVDSGTTLAIAGLLQDEVRGIASRLPGLGELPILGALFRSVNYQRSRTELVILVTPEIAAPMMPNDVPPLPGEDIFDPSDIELYLGGKLYGDGPAAADELPEDFSTELVVERIRDARDQLSLHGPWGHADLNEAGNTDLVSHR